MSDAAQARLLVVMGSGETSPTMVTIHKELAARLGSGRHRAILLDTPYAFQENAADISARAQAYFARSVGLEVSVVSDADRTEQANPQARAGLAAIRSSDWVFAGPGSPSYALTRWRGNQVADAIRERIAAGTGITIIASAAAAAIGFAAVPVYEIYKVGADPHWLEGLDLLSVLGLKIALIPHYDNAEGGTHDTRFCYLGERRLAVLERELPDDAAVLGVDEHTALIIDLATRQAEVSGRGGATVRKAGVSTVLPAGIRIELADLAAMFRSGGPAPGQQAGQPGQPGQDRRAAAAGRPARDDAGQPGSPAQPGRALNEVTDDAAGRFEAAAGDRDGAAMAEAVLDLEAAIEAWSTDTDENDNADRARAVLRGLVARLGRAAQDGLADPADRLRPALEPLVGLRDKLRAEKAYAAADVIRDALAAAGVELRDAPGGTEWAIGAAR